MKIVNEKKELSLPQMILIGSTSRNSGKTTIAIKLIESLKKKVKIIGLKVTSIDRKDGRCPRGGKGCGVCSSLKGNYQIIKEKISGGKKDTSLLLAAGANEVFWIKTLKLYSYEAITEFLSYIPKDSIIICESNSLRNVVKPAIFIMLKKQSESFIKDSAKQVIDKADIVLSLERLKNEETIKYVLSYVSDYIR